MFASSCQLFDCFFEPSQSTIYYVARASTNLHLLASRLPQSTIYVLRACFPTIGTCCCCDPSLSTTHCSVQIRRLLLPSNRHKKIYNEKKHPHTHTCPMCPSVCPSGPSAQKSVDMTARTHVSDEYRTKIEIDTDTSKFDTALYRNFRYDTSDNENRVRFGRIYRKSIFRCIETSDTMSNTTISGPRLRGVIITE